MNHVENLIVGAGPGGLQLAQHLSESQRDYLLLEATGNPGSFFESFPRHRTLISLNKRFNLYASPSFNMRHDWNTILPYGHGPKFTEYSEDLFPQADDYVRYLRDYCIYHKLRIRTNSRATHISRGRGDTFVVTVNDEETLSSDRIFLATGAVAPRIPDVKGIELATGYHNHTLDARAYRNRKVAIIGRGNSAFEIANHIAPEAAIVHMLVAHPVKHAWDTHYPGDLRAINNTVLDMYQLKSLHATLAYQVQAIRRSDSGLLAVDVEEELPHWDPPAIQRRTIEYHDVIYCTGWQYVDPTLFDDRCAPRLTVNGKYLELSPWWETSISGIYCVGTSMQARDKKAASGFLHGFRYNVRALHRRIEDQIYGVPYPRLVMPLEDERTLVAATDVLLRRLSTTSGLYQQFSVLGDVVTFTEREVIMRAEVPIAHAVNSDEYRDSWDDVFTIMSLEYGFDRYSGRVRPLEFIRPFDPGRPECSAFLHPVFRTYRHGELVDEAHLGESFDLRWDAEAVHDSWEVGHRDKVMQVLNRARRLLPKDFDTQYAGMKRRANLRPLERVVAPVGSTDDAGPDKPCAFRS